MEELREMLRYYGLSVPQRYPFFSTMGFLQFNDEPELAFFTSFCKYQTIPYSVSFSTLVSRIAGLIQVDGVKVKPITQYFINKAIEKYVV